MREAHCRGIGMARHIRIGNRRRSAPCAATIWHFAFTFLLVTCSSLWGERDSGRNHGIAFVGAEPTNLSQLRPKRTPRGIDETRTQERSTRDEKKQSSEHAALQQVRANHPKRVHLERVVNPRAPGRIWHSAGCILRVPGRCHELLRLIPRRANPHFSAHTFASPNSKTTTG